MRTAQTCVAQATNLIVQGNFQQAIQVLTQAVSLDPHHITAYLSLGNTYIKLKKYDLAIQAFKKSIDINPDISNIHRCMGNAYRLKGDFSQAMKSYQKAKDLNDSVSEVYVDIGIVCIDQAKDYKKAVENFEKAIEIDGFNVSALNHCASVYIKLEELQKASMYNQKALLISPNSHDALQIKAKLEKI